MQSIHITPISMSVAIQIKLLLAFAVWHELLADEILMALVRFRRLCLLFDGSDRFNIVHALRNIPTVGSTLGADLFVKKNSRRKDQHISKDISKHLSKKREGERDRDTQHILC